MKGGGDELQRRRFLATAGGRVVAALATGVPNLLLAKGQTPAAAALDQRLADVIEGYDAQGSHRTGTPADNASAEWLAKRVQEAGAEPSLEPFPLSRIDPLSCYVRITDRRIGGMPLFDATFTDAEGVRGTLGPIGSDAEIGLAESEPSRLTEPGSEAQRARISAVRQAKHKAVILLTRGTRPGLFLLNAPAFKAPFGPPTLQVSSAEAEWLKVQAQQRAEATLVAHVDRTEAQAFNDRRKDLPKRALAFIHFGANIGAARQPNLIQASSDTLEQWAVTAMEREGLNVNRKAARSAAPFGEAAVFMRAGGQYVALVCDNDAFHNPADRWPDAVDVAVLARYATALAKGALELAQQRP
jgi:hypothetical protein